MIRLVNWILGVALFVSTTLAMATSPNITYDFTTEATASENIAGLNFGGATTGRLVTHYSQSEHAYVPQTLVLQIKNLPKLVITGFVKNENFGSTSYTAKINNAFIFRSLEVNLSTDGSFNTPKTVWVDFFIDTQENYAVSEPNAYPVYAKPHFINMIFEPIARTNFSTIDIYKTSFQGDKVIIKLNKNIALIKGLSESTSQPTGIELNITWFGHGERSYYIPMPSEFSTKPYAIESENDGINSEMITIKFLENGSDLIVQRPLDMMLQEAFQL